MTLSPSLIGILACPACASRPVVVYDEKNEKLICAACGRKYPVRDGIPIMLVEEAEK